MKSIAHSALTFKIHKKSVDIKINRGRLVPSSKGSTQRGDVKEFSYRSERRMRFALEDTADLWNVFAMLSYPGEYPCNGLKVKRDIRALIRWLRHRNHHDFFWGLEFQRRGAPHINLLLSKTIDKEDLAKAWYRIVGSGDEKHLRAGTGIAKVRQKDSMATYILGYVRKRWQKDVPEGYENVGRFWGCSRSAVEKSTYTYQFKDTDALETFMKPVVAQYEANMKEWAQKREKPYTWKYKGSSFVMWSGAEFINKLIEGGQNNEEEKEEESRTHDVRRNDGIDSRDALSGSGHELRRMYRLTHEGMYRKKSRRNQRSNGVSHRTS